MKESFYLILTNYTSDLILALGLILLFVISLFVTYWIYNRRKFHKLLHQIPASVVNNYLESIIQNTSSLKSCLMRGGDVPSVVPVADLSAGPVGLGGPSREEINQKNAELASLREQLADKDRMLADLERKSVEMQAAMEAGDSGAEIKVLNDKISGLDNELKNSKEELATAKAALEEAQAGAGTGDSADLQRQLTEVTKERDALKKRLTEYEIIEEDLAKLKSLQIENEELKKSLEELKAGGAPAEAPASEPAPEPEPEPEAAPAEPAEEEDLEAQMAAAIGGGDAEEPAPEAKKEEKKSEESDKSAEDLLDEFEKMLG